MKKVTIVFMSVLLICCTAFCMPANAVINGEDAVTVTVEELENGCYIETVITGESVDPDSSAQSSSTITKTKTKYYKNSSGDVLWSVSIKAKFTYDGSTSKCKSCSHSTTSPGSRWTIKSSSSSKSGNSATAKAVATYKNTAEYSMSVTIKCSADGTVS